LNTRPGKSLAYGPGILQDISVGHDVEFVIQARNDRCENRTSGRDPFTVIVHKIVKDEDVPEGEMKPEPEEIDVTMVDNDDGTYSCKYLNDTENDCKVQIMYEDEKGDNVHIRGSPFVSTFSTKAKASDNTMTGGILGRYITKELERI